MATKQQWKQIKLATSLMIIADESFRSVTDLEILQDYCHGINIKMEKCGGPFEAVKILK
jgi:L-alanine-DL-glutamate epimerase-like enolase superfamily enzyme